MPVSLFVLLYAATLVMGGATLDGTYRQLQQAAAARDIAGIAAALDDEHRGIFLGDLAVLAMRIGAGDVEGVTIDPAQSKAFDDLMTTKVLAALEANPPDMAIFEGKSEAEKLLIAIRYGTSKLPKDDMLALVRAIDAIFAAAKHPIVGETIGEFVRQIPKGPLKVRDRKDDAVFGEADGRPINFVRRDGRWYAAGVWYIGR